MTTRARASAGNGRGRSLPRASAKTAPSRVGTLPGAAADAGRLPPLPAGRGWPAVTQVFGTAVSRSVRDPSNGADDYFAVKDRRLGRSLRSRLRGAKPAPPRLRPPRQTHWHLSGWTGRCRGRARRADHAAV